MERFRFLLLDRDRSVIAERTRDLPDAASIWPEVEDLLADDRATPGQRISVRDSEDRIVASLGVAQALHLFGQGAV
jgi:hypothetical protein